MYEDTGDILGVASSAIILPATASILTNINYFVFLLVFLVILLIINLIAKYLPSILKILSNTEKKIK